MAVSSPRPVAASKLRLKDIALAAGTALVVYLLQQAGASRQQDRVPSDRRLLLDMFYPAEVTSRTMIAQSRIRCYSCVVVTQCQDSRPVPLLMLQSGSLCLHVPCISQEVLGRVQLDLPQHRRLPWRQRDERSSGRRGSGSVLPAQQRCAVYNNVAHHVDVAAGLAWAFQVHQGGLQACDSAGLQPARCRSVDPRPLCRRPAVAQCLACVPAGGGLPGHVLPAQRHTGHAGEAEAAPLLAAGPPLAVRGTPRSTVAPCRGCPGHPKVPEPSQCRPVACSRLAHVPVTAPLPVPLPLCNAAAPYGGLVPRRLPPSCHAATGS